MSIPNARGAKRRPVHPGEVLREEFLPQYGSTPTRLAAALAVSRRSVNELLGERRALSPEMALRLARAFGNYHSGEPSVGSGVTRRGSGQ